MRVDRGALALVAGARGFGRVRFGRGFARVPLLHGAVPAVSRAAVSLAAVSLILVSLISVSLISVSLISVSLI